MAVTDLGDPDGFLLQRPGVIRLDINTKLGFLYGVHLLLKKNPKENESYGWLLFLNGQLEPTVQDILHLKERLNSLYGSKALSSP